MHLTWTPEEREPSRPWVAAVGRRRMNIPGRRAHILDPNYYLGIGVAPDSYGRIFECHEFQWTAHGAEVATTIANLAAEQTYSLILAADNDLCEAVAGFIVGFVRSNMSNRRRDNMSHALRAAANGSISLEDYWSIFAYEK